MDIGIGIGILIVMVIGILWEILMDLRTIRHVIDNKR